MRRGGVARLDPDGALTVVATADESPDPRALPLAADGTVLILDAELGPLRLPVGGVVEAAWSPHLQIGREVSARIEALDGIDGRSVNPVDRLNAGIVQVLPWAPAWRTSTSPAVAQAGGRVRLSARPG